MQNNPKVYILLRTHNRPDEFKRCIRSIEKQSVIPKVIIISDDQNDHYIQDIKLSHQVFNPVYKKPRWWIRHHNPFNDYFNQVLCLVPDGNFVYYLDDDDELFDVDWIKTIIEKDVDILIAKFQLGESHNYKIIGECIERGKVGGSCIALRSTIAKKYKWKSRGAGDFFFIKDIVNKYIPTFIDIIAAKVQKDLNHSWGVRKKY